MKKKSYKITFSLQEGYAPDAKIHRISTAERIIKDWLAERLRKEESIVTGLLQQGTLFFPANDAVSASPTAIFTGELSKPKDMKRSNREVKNTLRSLAALLKDRLK